MIDFACSSCRQNFSVKAEFAGRQAKCPKCKTVLKVPKEIHEPSPSIPDDGLDDLLDEIGIEPLDTQSKDNNTTRKCPMCKAEMNAQSVLCIECGYDWRMHRRRPTSRDETPESRSSILREKSLLLGFLYSVVGAAIGAAVWAAVAISIDYEIGWIAWGLGAFAGLGMATGNNDRDNLIAGLIASAVAVGGILAAKMFVLHWLSIPLQAGDGSFGLTTIWAMFDGYDLLFVLLAVVTAFRVGTAPFAR